MDTYKGFGAFKYAIMITNGALIHLMQGTKISAYPDINRFVLFDIH